MLLAWGYAEARRGPRVRQLDVQLPRLGAGFDSAVVLVTDTHYGPLDRARWSARVCAKVNTLEADLVCHTGDIADGTAEHQHAQAAPLGTVRATRARVYVAGNHEYYSEAQGWVDLMDELGWEPLRNRHLLLERGGDTLVVAGVDDVAAESSGLAGHRAHLAGALNGVDPDLPVLLLAHQPKFVDRAAAGGVDLQLSGHTHGGQIWPFHHLVRIDQPPSPASAATAPAPSSTPAAAPASGARRSASSPPARSPCSYSAPRSGPPRDSTERADNRRAPQLKPLDNTCRGEPSRPEHT